MGRASLAAGPERRKRLLLALLAPLALLMFVLVAYELALARVPQHRAALERLVRAQTGLDVRFSELGLRWGWYGPGGVFRHAELDEPGAADALLRASELVVGFDAWRTLRSGHPEAGRIELVAPDIDFAPASTGCRQRARRIGPSRCIESAAPALALERLSLLQNWRGSRIDIEGGTLRLPSAAPDGAIHRADPPRASLRRAGEPVEHLRITVASGAPRAHRPHRAARVRGSVAAAATQWLAAHRCTTVAVCRVCRTAEAALRVDGVPAHGRWR